MCNKSECRRWEGRDKGKSTLVLALVVCPSRGTLWGPSCRAYTYTHTRSCMWDGSSLHILRHHQSLPGLNNMHSISIISHIAARCPVTNQRHTTTSKCRTMVQRSSENTPHSTDAGVTASHGRQSSPLPQAQSSFSTRSSCCTVSSSSEVTVEPRWRERRLPRGAFLATVSIERRSLSGDRRGPSGDTMVG